MEQPLPPPSRGDKQLQDLVATEASAHDEMENEQNLTNDQPNAVDAAKTFIQNHTTIANSSATNGGDSKADFTQSEHNKMTELLDSWEDGDAVEEKTVGIAAVAIRFVAHNQYYAELLLWIASSSSGKTHQHWFRPAIQTGCNNAERQISIYTW